MKMEHQIHGKITSANDTEMLSALEWLRDNYGTKVQNAQATGSTEEIQFNLLESSFNDAVTTFIALKTQFSARLIEYDLIMNQ